jgi:hypothetical protein
MAECHIRFMEAWDMKSDVTSQFLVGDLVIRVAGIFHVYCAVQKLLKNFRILQQLRNFFIFGGYYDPKIFLQISKPLQGT